MDFHPKKLTPTEFWQDMRQHIILEDNEDVLMFNDQTIAGSLAMTS